MTFHGKPQMIISGGQTGADRGGLDAAIELGIPHGGFCPRDRKAEDGAIPAKYQLKELPDSHYRARTVQNVDTADAVLVFFGTERGPGTLLTCRLALAQRKPLHQVSIDAVTEEQATAGIREFLERVRPAVLMVAGSRESGTPGIESWVHDILVTALS